MKTSSLHPVSPAASRRSHQDRTCAALLALVVVTLLPVVGFAQDSLPEGWVSFDGLTAVATSPTLEITSSDLSELTLLVTTPGVVSTAVAHGDTEYARLSLPGYHHTTEVGYPCIPTVRQLIPVPEGCEMEVSVSTGDSVIYTDATVYPVEAAVTRYTEEGWPYIAHEFAQDGDAYAASGYYPAEIASVSDEGSLRGQGVALLTVHPIQYDAAARRLRAFRTLTVTVRFSGGTGTLSEPVGPLGSIARSVLLNYRGTTGRGREPGGPGEWGVCETVQACGELHADYLMIVEGSLMASPWVETLATHRATWNGYNVAIVPSTAVGNPISATLIKAFIKGVYYTQSAEHMEDGYLGYVLLVGDARDSVQAGTDTLLPAREVPYGDVDIPWITTDHRYACVQGPDGDENADLMIGRLCAGNETELEIEVSKITSYETTADSEDAWRKKILLSCGFTWGPVGQSECGKDDQAYAASTDAAFDFVTALLPEGYDVDEIHAHAQQQPTCWERHDAVQAHDFSAVNDGLWIAHQSTHGWKEGSWTFNPGELGQLENGEALPFWVSIACLTGAYDHTPLGTSVDCLGEQLMHNYDLNGTVGFFGSTELSLGGPVQYLAPYVWEGIFEERLHTVGEFLSYAKLKYFSQTGDMLGLLEFNLLGDPALDIMLTDSQGYGSAPDYVVTEADLAALPEFPSAGSPVQLQALVHNNSNYNPDFDVVVRFEMCEPDGSDCTVIGTDEVRPEAYRSALAEVPWTPSYADVGQRVLRVVVDPDTAQAELFEDNNEAEWPVGICFNRAGFPVDVGGLEGLAPTIADLDGDGDIEIRASVRTPGRVKVLSAEGAVEWPFGEPGVDALRGAPAVGDLDFDGDQEVVVCCGDSVHALRGEEGDPVWAAPYYAEGLDSGPVLADVRDGQGDLEVVVARTWPVSPATDELVAISSQGAWLWANQRAGYSPTPSFPENCPSAADLDSDGRADVVSTSVDLLTGPCARAVGGGGSTLWTTGLVGPDGAFPCNPVLADVCPDSSGLEVLCGVGGVKCLSRSSGDPVWSIDLDGYVAGLAACDLDGDGTPEIVATTYGTLGSPGACSGKLYVLDGEGNILTSARLDYSPKTAPTIGYLDDDAQPEILATSSCTCWFGATQKALSHLDVFTFTSESRLARFDELPRPLFFWGHLTSTPAIADTDKDGWQEIIVVDGEGNAHCMEYWGEPGGSSRWASYQHDGRHTGTYETPVSGPYPAGTSASWWGDYHMSGDVTIGATSSLLIQPGSTVRAAPNSDDQSSGADPNLAELIVDGGLTVGGDPLMPVTLRSGSLTPVAGDWRGIRLKSASTGVVSDATVSHAFIGIDATNPASVHVEDSVISDSEVMGIKCSGNAGQSTVHLVGNTVSRAQVGVELWYCKTQADGIGVDGNRIADCTTRGMKILQDRGSKVRGNKILWITVASPGSGMYVEGSRRSLVIARNAIGDPDTLGLSTIGIDYELSYWSDAGMIKKNVVSGSGPEAYAKAMYFYNSQPKVRRNTLGGWALHTGFWVAGTGMRPDLGTASGVTCTACMDTTLTGCNRVVPEIDAGWDVKVEPGSPNVVMAECNRWGKDGPRIYGPVDWEPELPVDPGEGREGPDGSEFSGLPSAATLLQNYPNPFNPETALTFGLPEHAHVRLEIYDLAGRLVRTLIDESMAPGWHHVVWDGLGGDGRPVAAGVYFCRLEAGHSKMSRKVVVLK